MFGEVEVFVYVYAEVFNGVNPVDGGVADLQMYILGLLYVDLFMKMIAKVLVVLIEFLH